MSLATTPRYDPDGVSPVGDHAVVVGASVAGLLAGRVLADAFDRVTVLEKDPLPDGPAVRPGVPQARQPHVLLEAGRATIEDLFPGFCEALVANGALLLDLASDLREYSEGGYLADGARRVPMYCATRPLVEFLLRERLLARDGVHLRGGAPVTDYRFDGAAVRGVVVDAGENPDGDDRDATVLDADLVVDATGNASRTPDRLAAAGFERPPTDEVSIDVGYASTFVERPPDDRRAWSVVATPPNSRAGMALPVEGDRWHLLLAGMNGDRPPGDPAGFREFAATLPTDDVGTLLDEHERTGDEVARYAIPANVWRRYDRLDRRPEGLVVLGDALARFNPIYGQGMTVAALEAVILHDAIATGGLGGLADRYFDRTADVVTAAWRLAVGGDFRYPETEGPKPPGTDLLNWYSARLVRRAHADGRLRSTLVRVTTMERPGTDLFRPRTLWRVLGPRP